MRKYVIQQQAQSIAGKQYGQKIYVRTGYGANGKSIETLIMDIIFGDYCMKLRTSMIAGKEKDKDTNVELIKLHGIRYAYSSEIPAYLKLKAGVCKDITGGETLSGRMLYSNEMTIFRPQCKLSIYCNKKIPLDGSDGGLSRRIQVVNYESTFSHDNIDEKNNIYERDDTLEDLIKDNIKFRQTYMNMLINTFKINYKYSAPHKVIQASKSYMNQNNYLCEFIEEFLIKDNGKYVQFKDIYDQFKGSSYYHPKYTRSIFKTDLMAGLRQQTRDMKINIYDSLGRPVLDSKGKQKRKMVRNAFWGYRLKEINEFDDEE
jgi:putative DNA primase/helicase